MHGDILTPHGRHCVLLYKYCNTIGLGTKIQDIYVGTFKTYIYIYTCIKGTWGVIYIRVSLYGYPKYGRDESRSKDLASIGLAQAHANCEAPWVVYLHTMIHGAIILIVGFKIWLININLVLKRHAGVCVCVCVRVFCIHGCKMIMFRNFCSLTEAFDTTVFVSRYQGYKYNFVIIISLCNMHR